MKKIIIGLVVVLLIVGGIVYYLFFSKKTMTIDEFESLSYSWGTGLVTLEEAYGFPNFDINKNLEVTLHPGQKNKNIADYKFNISKEDLEKIIKSINDNNFLRLGNLVQNDCQDASDSTIKIKTKTYEKEVHIYCKKNERFENVEDTIYEVVNKNKELTNYSKKVVEQAKILLNGDKDANNN